MASQNYFDYCILGAGLAGLSLADALSKQGRIVAVLEKEGIAAGASGTPGGLVNPATGRRGRKSWKAELCYKAIHSNLQKIQQYTQKTFFKQNGLLRPALSEKMFAKMKAEFKKTAWPAGWCQWLSEQEVKKKHPGIQCVGGGLWLPIVLTVDVKAYLMAYQHYLTTQNITIQTAWNGYISREAKYWSLKNKQHQIRSQHLIYATGYGTLGHPFWEDLNFFAIKGQLATFKGPAELLNFAHSISGMGYIARLGNTANFIQGSTYEHDFDHLKPDKEGVSYLLGRLEKMLPQLAKKVQLINQWSGVRLSTPNRKPVAGTHPNDKNLHLFTGLGSKGLLYSKFLANHLAKHLLNGTPLYPEVSIKRML